MFKTMQNSKFHVVIGVVSALDSVWRHLCPRGLAVQHVNRLKPRFLLVSGDLTNVKALCWLMANLHNFKHLAELIQHVWHMFDTHLKHFETCCCRELQERLLRMCSCEIGVQSRELKGVEGGWRELKGVEVEARHGQLDHKQIQSTQQSRWWRSRRSGALS